MLDLDIIGVIFFISMIDIGVITGGGSGGGCGGDGGGSGGDGSGGVVAMKFDNLWFVSFMMNEDERRLLQMFLYIEVVFSLLKRTRLCDGA